MYCHSLDVEHGHREFNVPCEDSPYVNDLVVMWPYELNLEESVFRDLVEALMEWATSSRMKCRIYTSKTDYETNECQVDVDA